MWYFPLIFFAFICLAMWIICHTTNRMLYRKIEALTADKKRMQERFHILPDDIYTKRVD